MFRLLETKKHKSAFSKLVAQVRYGTSQKMDKDTLQVYDMAVGRKELGSE